MTAWDMALLVKARVPPAARRMPVAVKRPLADLLMVRRIIWILNATLPRLVPKGIDLPT